MMYGVYGCPGLVTIGSPGLVHARVGQIRERKGTVGALSRLLRSVCEWNGVFFRVSSTLGEGDN